VVQYVPLLAKQGIDMDVRPFLSNRVFAGLYDRKRVLLTAGGIVAGIARRMRDVLDLDTYDLVFVQREAALVGPPVLEWVAHRGLPMVLDLDDSTYIERPSDVFGFLASIVKWRGKTDRLIQWSEHVICGNPAIAAHVESQGKPSTIVPTLVDTEQFTPRQEKSSGVLTIGWIGTHSTFPYLRTLLLPVFQRLSRSYRFRLRIVGAGDESMPIPGVEVQFLPWKLERELDDLRSFDIAVYPIVPDIWAQGKSGFKAIQYLSCGIPYVASPVGIVSAIGEPRTTHFEANTEDEWVATLSRLLSDTELREEMGRKGRLYAEEHFSTRRAGTVLADVFRNIAGQARDRSAAKLRSDRT
jgi:glycosyltransferase involved in cell wall biosynthesis